MSIDLKSNLIERSLPSEWYTSDKVFYLEQEYIYSKEWVCAGREEHFPAVGDYKVLEIAGESIIVVRNESGHTLLNIDEDIGNFKSVIRVPTSNIILDVLPCH